MASRNTNFSFDNRRTGFGSVIFYGQTGRGNRSICINRTPNSEKNNAGELVYIFRILKTVLCLGYSDENLTRKKQMWDEGPQCYRAPSHDNLDK